MTFHPLQRFVDHLSAHTHLTDEEKSVLLALPVGTQRVANERPLIQAEEVARSSCIVLSGLLARVSHTQGGGRQITSFYVPGDIADLDTVLRPRASFGLQAVCSSEVARVPHTGLLEAMRGFAGISEAFARQLVRDADIASEWVVNLGKRMARERIAHLFCEMAVKNKKDQETDATFAFPVTQSVLGDATGLSTVHVNRSTQSLRHEGLLMFAHGTAHIPNWQALADVADFDGGYLESNEPMRRVAPPHGPTEGPPPPL